MDGSSPQCDRLPLKFARLIRFLREHDRSASAIRNQIFALTSDTHHAARMLIPALTNGELGLIHLIPFGPISTFPLVAKRVFEVSSVFLHRSNHKEARLCL
jgi:hypothetical protein